MNCARLASVSWLSASMLAFALTTLACGSDEPAAATTTTDELSGQTSCTYGGVTQSGLGDFRAADGCNACRCIGGAAVCTKRACVPTADADAPVTCSYDGKTYVSGQSFPSSDGCNTCFCGQLGVPACTKRLCLPVADGGDDEDAATDGGAAVDATSPPSTCTYGGTVYAEGASFPSTDGCNSCFCGQAGVACTKKACTPPVDAGADAGPGCLYDGKQYAPGASFPSSDNCNTCTCVNRRALCTKKACVP